MKIGQFMLLPFLAIYLSKYSCASPSVIGVTVGIGPFIYAITGIVSGVFVDRFGVKKVMMCALFLGGVAIFFFFQEHSVSWFFLMNSLTGATRAFFDIGSKTYGVSRISVEQRRIFFSLRFMVSNGAAAIGPIIGAYFALTNSFLAFKITGILYFALSVLASFFLRDTNKKEQLSCSKKIVIFRDVINILLQDGALRILLLISTIILSVYSQIDSTLAQYLHAELSNGVSVYSLLLIINAIICVMFQLIVSKMTKNLDDHMVCIFSMVLFVIAYAIIAFFLSVSALIVSIIIMTLAEIIVIPLNDLLLSRIAPANRIGTYYGIAGAAMLGFGIGPTVGGFIYEYLNAKILFLICSGFCLLVMFLYKKLFDEIAREKYVNEKNKCDDNSKRSDWNHAGVV